MTSEHCGHECVCNLYLNECWYGHLLADKSLPCDMKGVLTKPCEHDTRTHSAAEPVPENCPHWHCGTCNKSFGLIEEEARKEEREKVPDEVFGTFSLADMLEYLESLRQLEGMR